MIDAQEGAYAEAERHFRAAIASNPRVVPAYLNLGRLYQEHTAEDAAAPQKALTVYQQLLLVDADNHEALFQAAHLSACAGEWASSRAFLGRLPAVARERPQALVTLAVDLAGLGDRTGVESVTARVIAHPDMAEEDVLALLPALERAGDATLTEALFAGLDARRLASAASLRHLALAQSEQGRLDAARETLERAMRVSTAPTVPLLLDLARVAYKQKDFRGVLGYLAHARDLDPKNAEVHFFFGISCVELNLGGEAYDALKKAGELAPDNPYVNFALGAVAIHRREPSEALPYFEK